MGPYCEVHHAALFQYIVELDGKANEAVKFSAGIGSRI